MDEQQGQPTLLSDGKRMRPVWRPGDGDGESSRHLIERSLHTIKGHPTWKLFVDDIEVPIMRNGTKEPPHFVYLDDKACYTIWTTKSYTNAEMREFWPFDFGHQGHIRNGRNNRGRPAYSDEEKKQYAKAPLRTKGQEFEFFGAYEVGDYEPARQKKRTRAEIEVEEEIANAKRARAGSQGDIEVEKEIAEQAPFSMDGARDDDDFDGVEYLRNLTKRCTRAQLPPQPARDARLLNENKDLREKNQTLLEKYQTVSFSKNFVVKENGHLRTVVVLQIAGKARHQAETGQRAITYQKLYNDCIALSKQAQRLAQAVAAEIAPTQRLSDSLSVLDALGKYMYDNGLDEEWKAYQKEAYELNMKETKDTAPSSQQKPWYYA